MANIAKYTNNYWKGTGRAQAPAPAPAPAPSPDNAIIQELKNALAEMNRVPAGKNASNAMIQRLIAARIAYKKLGKWNLLNTMGMSRYNINGKSLQRNSSAQAKARADVQAALAYLNSRGTYATNANRQRLIAARNAFVASGARNSGNNLGYKRYNRGGISEKKTSPGAIRGIFRRAFVNYNEQIFRLGQELKQLENKPQKTESNTKRIRQIKKRVEEIKFYQERQARETREGNANRQAREAREGNANRQAREARERNANRRAREARRPSNYHASLSDFRKKLRYGDKQAILRQALHNLNTRLASASKYEREILIGNYRSLSNNKSYRNSLNRRSKAYNSNRNTNEIARLLIGGGSGNRNRLTAALRGGGGFPGGGQQIVFGGGAQPPAPAIVQPGGAQAPVFLPSPGGGGAPVFLPSPGGGGGGAPSISVAPTIKVNVPPAVTQALPPLQRTALNNAGGYHRAASVIQSAGGPNTVERAINALNRNKGNVEKAMENTGLPRSVFKNVNKLGGPVTAKRTLTAVKTVSKRARGFTSSRARGPNIFTPSRARVFTPSRTVKKKKKRVVSAQACPRCKRSSQAKLKKIVAQIPRKNLERNVIACLLP